MRDIKHNIHESGTAHLALPVCCRNINKRASKLQLVSYLYCNKAVSFLIPPPSEKRVPWITWGCSVVPCWHVSFFLHERTQKQRIINTFLKMIRKSAEESGGPSQQCCQYLEHDGILFLEVSDTNVLFLERFLLLPVSPASLRLPVPIFLLQLPCSRPFPTIDFPPLSPEADGPGCTLHCSAGLEGGKCQCLIQLPMRRHSVLLTMSAGNPVGFQLILWKGTSIRDTLYLPALGGCLR